MKEGLLAAHTAVEILVAMRPKKNLNSTPIALVPTVMPNANQATHATSGPYSRAVASDSSHVKFFNGSMTCFMVDIPFLER